MIESELTGLLPDDRIIGMFFEKTDCVINPEYDHISNPTYSRLWGRYATAPVVPDGQSPYIRYALILNPYGMDDPTSQFIVKLTDDIDLTSTWVCISPNSGENHNKTYLGVYYAKNEVAIPDYGICVKRNNVGFDYCHKCTLCLPNDKWCDANIKYEYGRDGKCPMFHVKRTNMQMHVTIGIYSNSDFVVNVVLDCHLRDHIIYNMKLRPGRILVVDGEYVCGGCMKDDKRIQLIHDTIDKVDRMNINRSKPTIPYR